ncbi:MAG: arylesterase [Deltaproteobacteria bacterium]|nr:arylesterase [Deltaproteobacteria bacterium]
MHLSFLSRLILILLLMLVLAVVPVFANSTLPGPVVILVLGDSLTAGYGLEETETFPFQLEKKLQAAGYHVTVINAGVSGDTTAGGLARLEWALADHPGIVIVELGGNDALRGLDPAQTYANLDKILVRLGAVGCRVILTGMKAPRNLGHEYYNKFDQIYPDLAAQYDVLFYPFFLEGVATDLELNQLDGIHPNAAGVQRIVVGITPLVTTALDEINT